MEISLENWLREKVDEHERNHDYAIATDSVRAYIDIYNDLKISEPTLQSDSSPMKQQIEEHIKEAEERRQDYNSQMKTHRRNLDYATGQHNDCIFFLSRLKEITKTPTSNCDFRKKECVNDGQIIDGVWRCNNHL